MARSRNRALVLEIVADPRKAQKGLKGIQGSISKFAGGMAKTAAAYFGTREILRFGQASITAASDLEESTNAVQRAMTGASDQIERLGRTSAKELGLSKTAINELAVAFAAFGTQIAPGAEGDAFEAIIQRATDFASVMNIEVEEAMATFQSALAGQSRPIREYGIDLSAAAVQAHALAVGIWDGNGAISEAEKVQGRYSLILKSTDQYAGDFLATADGLANSTRILSAEWKDLQAELGKEALPLAADAVHVLTGAVENAEVYTLRLMGAWHEYSSILKAEGGAFMGSMTAGIWGGAQNDASDYQHMLAQVINSQKLYHRELASTGDEMHSYASAQLRLIKSGEANFSVHGRLQDSIGATNLEYLLALKRLREYSDENGIYGKALDDLNYQISLQAQLLDHDLRPALEKQSDQWDAYVDAMGRTGQASTEANRNLESVTLKILGIQRAIEGLDDPFGIWDYESWGELEGSLVELRRLWDDVTAARDRATARSEIRVPAGGIGGVDAGAPAANVSINFNGIVGDPIAVGAQVTDVMHEYASSRGGGF